jgi:formamidopyrimidine-DNA glycosylase
MRWPVPAHLPQTVAGQIVRRCERRGKYLLIGFDSGTMIVHLGMSGSLRRAPISETRRKHDHIEWLFDDARFLLHDPRRFGAVLWHDHNNGPVQTHPLLANLGVEPFDPGFTGTTLHHAFKNKKQAIKTALLAGDVVVGVGNIYASEALFRARINPKTAAGRLSLARCLRLRDATGAPGSYFDIHAAVYNRANQPCRVCLTPIKKIIQGQRATYYCPKCQMR